MTAPPAGSLSGYRILVVEDQYFVADDLRRALGREGAEVLGPVPDLASGLGLATDGALDAAVLDVNLSGDMSFQIADALGARAVPFLFATGYDDDALPSRYDAVPRIEKPFDPSTVIAALGRIVGTPARPAA